MQKRILSLFVLLCLTGSSLVYAQQEEPPKELNEVPIKRTLLPYNNPMLVEDASPTDSTVIRSKVLGDFQKDIMNRIASIYSVHVKAIQAQLNNNPVGAEKHITEAISQLQNLLDDYPEVRSDRRFNELYRSVMAEYREFYGIDPEEQVKGEIFAIQEELFSERNDWVVEDYSLPEDITMNKTEVPLVRNRQVSRSLMYYTLKRPEVMENWLARSEKYFPMMKKIFEEEGAPAELVHLSMIESGLNPTARSWASAVGMWQFIRATGSTYGLEVNWWVDERRDPEKATRAAARHLRDLHDIWGDWHLAMANYNISPRGLKRAIRAAGGVEDYWAAFPYLPRETKGYVPGFIAATMVANNPESFGFQKNYNVSEYSYEVAEVDPLMPLDKLAEAAGISTKELKEYNPELLRWATPPGAKYNLKLPTGTKEQFVANYDSIPKEDRSQNIAMHTVQRGQTLGTIARKYGTSVRSLYETNENLSHIIYPGQKIVVPLAPGTSRELAVNRPTHQPRGSSGSSRSSRSRSRASAPPNTTPMGYTVKSGDTIGHIAEWYDVRAYQVRSWNGASNVIRPGQELTIYVPRTKVNYYQRVDELSFAEKQRIEREQRSGKDVTRLYASNDSAGESGVTYRVRQNDTLSEIATSFGVPVSQIRQLNNINGSRIYPGQTLRIK